MLLIFIGEEKRSAILCEPQKYYTVVELYAALSFTAPSLYCIIIFLRNVHQKWKLTKCY